MLITENRRQLTGLRLLLKGRKRRGKKSGDVGSHKWKWVIGKRKGGRHRRHTWTVVIYYGKPINSTYLCCSSWYYRAA